MPLPLQVLCIWPFTSLFTFAITASFKGYDAWGIIFVSVLVGFFLSIMVVSAGDIAEMYKEED